MNEKRENPAQSMYNSGTSDKISLIEFLYELNLTRLDAHLTDFSLVLVTARRAIPPECGKY